MVLHPFESRKDFETTIFNLILNLFRSGDRTMISNYRPIGLLSALSKILSTRRVKPNLDHLVRDHYF